VKCEKRSRQEQGDQQIDCVKMNKYLKGRQILGFVSSQQAFELLMRRKGIEGMREVRYEGFWIKYYRRILDSDAKDISH
jgi:hypothetical protein